MMLFRDYSHQTPVITMRFVLLFLRHNGVVVCTTTVKWRRRKPLLTSWDSEEQRNTDRQNLLRYFSRKLYAYHGAVIKIFYLYEQICFYICFLFHFCSLEENMTIRYLNGLLSKIILLYQY